VAERGTHGGHNIPEVDLIRRFPRSLHNLLNVFAPKVNQVRCFMNDNEKPELVFQQTGVVQTILHADFFILLQQEAQS
jgi:predicted ABC-type ATPase